ncbi:MAG: hypothetical protein JW924_00690 [Fusobacteriaceae bacterium]|nr:hypothetical protein [Fusobacteriaceae bacterium]
MLPELIVNKEFIKDFFKEEKPCCGVGVIGLENSKKALIALRLNESIPTQDWGFQFGNSLYGSSRIEVIHFGFEFYSFKNFNVLINPNNSVVQEVLKMMIETKDYFFLLINSDNSVVAYRSEITSNSLYWLEQNLDRIKNSQTTHEEYLKCISSFEKNPVVEGDMLNWLYNDNSNYLNLEDYIKLNPQS